MALAGFTRVVRVTAVVGRAVSVDAVLAAGDFAFGRVRWIEGRARGVSATVLGNDAASLTLASVPKVDDLVGARVELVAGCDKRAVTCAGRFSNIANFRGEPHLPGIDLLTRFPGG